MTARETLFSMLGLSVAGSCCVSKNSAMRQVLSGHWYRHSSLLAAIVGALLFQSVLIHGHVHFDRVAIETSASSETGTAPADPQDEPSQKSCLLCDEAASGGDGLLPEQLGLPLQVTAAWIFAARVSRPLDVSQVSHRWQSRAPPR